MDESYHDVDKGLNEYLGCDMKFNEKRDGILLHQSHILRGLKKKFEKLVKGRRHYETPGTPHKNVLRTEDNKIDNERQTLYRSGVGILLYLVKHTKPDLANATRELSKCLDFTSEDTWNELLRVIKYAIDTDNRGLIIKPEFNGNEWIIEIWSDSDYAGDPDTRISVGGYVLFIIKVAVSWKSKAQKSVTLSSTEAEFIALSEAAKEATFIYQLLKNMGIKVRLPINIYVDNVGAIFMAENVNTSQRTKHVDIRYKFVHDYIFDGFIKVTFTKTDDNIADIFTKNVTSELFKKHENKIIGMEV